MELHDLRILGLDVSKSSVSACLLTDKPIQPRQFYYEYPFQTLNADVEGIKSLLALKPDIAVMEPTGINYMKLWATHLTHAGVEVRLVGHKELRNYRAHHLALPDKDDDADALALACYCFDYLSDRRRFVIIRDPAIAQIRELILRLGHLNRVQSPIINRLRQDLAWQFPEVANIQSRRGKSGNTPLLWAWLAEERPSRRYDNIYSRSVGLGITHNARRHAERLCGLQREEVVIESELTELLADLRFVPYRKIFKRFGFGERLEAIILSQIFPMENYFGSDSCQKSKSGRAGNPVNRQKGTYPYGDFKRLWESHRQRNHLEMLLEKE
jgi:Transposase